MDLVAEGFGKYAIVGASGAGKSTLISLLGGFIAPDRGRIVVDGAPLPDFKQEGWQRQIVYIPQDPYLVHATVRENIAFYRPEATSAEVDRAVRVVGLDDLVAELPEGLDTVVGEGARTLSGGQAQRIALARAFLDDTRRILLFDEPTAHLDIETEMELKERMLPLMEGRLVFFATHRLHWLHDMDKIVVLEDGRIAELGTLDEL
ncbi:MAG: ATP-binding cassette domain-containing protein, partial [Eggerthellaceae bacterium]